MSILALKKMAGKKETTGGKREGAGRKPIDETEKKVQLTFYVKPKNKAAIKAKIEPIVKKMDK